MGGRGGGPPDPEISGVGGGAGAVSEFFFGPSDLSLVKKLGGGGGVSRALHSDPPLYKTDISLKPKTDTES